LYIRGGQGGRDAMVGRLRRFFSLWRSVSDVYTNSQILYLSHANCAHAYGRAISSSGFMDVATLRERVSRESANSISSGGSGPLNVGIKPVRACSMLARLILEGCQKLSSDVVSGVWSIVDMLNVGASSRSRAVTWTLRPPLFIVFQH